MENWKIVRKIALAFGLVFVVFAAFAAFLQYETLSYEYGNVAPTGYVIVRAVSTMLPFLMLAVLSFVVSALSKRGREPEKQTEEAPSMQNEIQSEPTEEESL